MNDNLILILSILGGLGGIGGFGAFIYVLFKHKFDNTVKHIETDSKDYYINQLNYQAKEDKKTPYKTNLAIALNNIDNFFGKKFFSIKAFQIHLTFTFVYSFLLFYLVWFFGGRAGLGEIMFFGENLTYFEKAFQTFFLIFVGVFLYFEDKYRNKIINTFNIQITILKKLLNIVYFFLLVLTLVFITYAVTETIGEGKIAIILSTIIMSIFINSKKEEIVAQVLIGISAMLMLNVVYIFAKYMVIHPAVLKEINTVYIFVTLFFIILPLTNALLDFISLAFTRYISEKILNENRWYMILFHALLDIFMAFVFLSLLAFLLIASIDIFNTFIATNLKNMISISELIHSVETDPFSDDSLWITLMLLSTLIPTFIHFVIAIYGSLILFGSRKTKKDEIVAILEKENIKSIEVTKVANYFAMKWLITITFAFSLTFALGALVYKIWF